MSLSIMSCNVSNYNPGNNRSNSLSFQKSFGNVENGEVVALKLKKGAEIVFDTFNTSNPCLPGNPYGTYAKIEKITKGRKNHGPFITITNMAQEPMTVTMSALNWAKSHKLIHVTESEANSVKRHWAKFF